LLRRMDREEKKGKRKKLSYGDVDCVLRHRREGTVLFDTRGGGCNCGEWEAIPEGHRSKRNMYLGKEESRPS